MELRRETSEDVAAIRAVHERAFGGAGSPPVEAVLVDSLRAGGAWLPALSLVAVRHGVVIGHVLCSRARVGLAAGHGALRHAAPGQDALGQDALGQDALGQDALGQEALGQDALGQDALGQDALGLAPLGVLPEHQRQGVGGALMHAVLAAADALDEPLVALLGHRDYYPRFGFRPATEYGITPPSPEWAEHFQVRTLTAYRPSIRGEFRYAPEFDQLPD